MRLRETGRALLGGAVVYVVMAACAPIDFKDSARGFGGGSVSDGGFEGGAGSSVDREGGSLVDALASPVRDAHAAVPPDVAVEECSLRVPINDAGGTYIFAEHRYPGKTARDLAALTVVGHLTPVTISSLPPGYESQIGLAYIKDGSAAVQCGAYTSLYFDRVTFILP